MEIPLSEQGLEETKGSFLYTGGSPHDPSVEGVFAFSFYIHEASSATPDNAYIRGISMYLDAIEAKESVFANWKIVLYTDAFTVSLLKDPSLRIGTSPRVDLVIVTWPYYSEVEGQVNGDVLRCMRLRSFFDFPHTPVLLRDADTLWAINEYGTGRKNLNTKPDDLLKWETTFFTYARRTPATFILGTSLGYRQRWHHNKQGKRYAPLGAFAGFQSAIPDVPCFQTKGLWEQAVTYILSRSQRTASGFSNESDPMKIGKDEQILTFLFVPACFDSIFFFEVDMYHKRTKATKDIHYFDPDYPAVIFERGSNANLKALFEEGMRTRFEENLTLRQQAIFAKNKEREVAEDEAIAEILKVLNTPLNRLGRSKESPLNYTSEQYYALSRIKDSVKDLDPANELAGLYDTYVKAEQAFSGKRRDAIKQIRAKLPGYNQERVLEDLRLSLEAKDQAIRTFLDKAVSLLPRSTLNTKLVKNHRDADEMLRLLNWYEGKAIAPPPPPPPAPSLASMGLGRYAQFFEKKKGGTQRKQKRYRTTIKKAKN